VFNQSRCYTGHFRLWLTIVFASNWFCFFDFSAGPGGKAKRKITKGKKQPRSEEGKPGEVGEY
jgi:hypothetical protein